MYLDSGRSSNAVLCIKQAVYTLHFIQDGFESFYSTYSISGLTFHFNIDSAWSLLQDSKDIFWTEAKLSCYRCVCMFMCTQMLNTNIALVHLCSASKTIHLCSNSACSIGILLCTNLNMCLCICGTWNHLWPVSYHFSSLKYSWYFSSKNPKIPNQAFTEKKIIQTWNTSH